MKKSFLLGFLLCFVLACSPDEEDLPRFYNEILPIESVNMPDEFEFGNTHSIMMTYLRPTGCHVFSDFYYLTEVNQRTVAIITTVFPNDDCQPLNEEEEVMFNFQVNDTGPYVFRFWQGVDENGNDVYQIIEVPVITD